MLFCEGALKPWIHTYTYIYTSPQHTTPQHIHHYTTPTPHHSIYTHTTAHHTTAYTPISFCGLYIYIDYLFYGRRFSQKQAKHSKVYDRIPHRMLQVRFFYLGYTFISIFVDIKSRMGRRFSFPLPCLTMCFFYCMSWLYTFYLKIYYTIYPTYLII
jgi:hypothetical protein